MRHSGWQLLAVSSLLFGILAAAETRPQYGGTLHAMTRIAPVSLDPADDSQPDTVSRRNVNHLLFDTLVTLDQRGQVEPALATSWQAASGNQRWQFWLRRGVKFQDGSPLTPEAVAASLRVANPSWNVSAGTDSVVIERQAPAPDLAAELARSRNGIAKHLAGGKVIGTGPFHVVDWQPGKKLSLSVTEGHWSGRAFLDAIEIEMGKSARDQGIALELGKSDIAELGTEQAPGVSADGRRVVVSAPVELMALMFSRDKQSPDESKMREVLALSIDRESIRSVVLQGVGEPSGAILPNWLTGYAFVYPLSQNLERARQERSEVQHAPSLSLGYDAEDAVARVIAERIALNARDAGLSLQVTTSANPDIRLVRVTLASPNPRVSLAAVVAPMGSPEMKLDGEAPEELYRAESAVLQTQRVIPLFQLPVEYALSPNVQDWSMDQDGSWHLEDVWLGSRRP